MTRRGSFGVPARLAFVVGGDVEPVEVYLMPLPDGAPLVLTETSALIWLLATDGVDDVAGAVADAVGKKAAVVREHVVDHLNELVERGLLTRLND